MCYVLYTIWMSSHGQWNMTLKEMWQYNFRCEREWATMNQRGNSNSIFPFLDDKRAQENILYICFHHIFHPARGIRLVCERGRPFHLCKQCNHKVKHHFSHTTFAHFIIVRLLVFHILFIFSSTFSTIIPSVLSMPLRLWLTLYPYSSPPSPNAIYFAAMALSVYDCVCFCREAERWPW